MLKEKFSNILTKSSPIKGNIVFIGMSGSGKSHWSKELERVYNIQRISIDNLIAESDQFKDLVAHIDGDRPVEKMGKYFGMPWEDGFKEKEQNFLNIETEIMNIYQNHNGYLIDTTGSAIYCPNALSNITKDSITVYLETSKEHQNNMFENFKKAPKPVCWLEAYAPKTNETKEDALARCYPTLLQTRAALYEQHANITVPDTLHKNISDVSELVTYITEQL